MPIRAVIYGRTSPDYPLTAEQQTDRLKAVADDHGWTVVRVFTDRPTSIRKGLDRRPGETALLEAIRNGVIDRVCISSICRVGKTVPDLVSFLETCRTAGVSLWIDEQRMDTAISNGMSLLDLGALMASHLRQSRRDAILRGLAAAKSLSIPCGRPRLSRARTEKATRELAAGKGVREAARIAGISAASVSRLKNAINVAAATAWWELVVNGREVLRDKYGVVTGEIRTERSKQTLLDRHFDRLGLYDPRDNLTRAKYGKFVAQGNLLVALLK